MKFETEIKVTESSEFCTFQIMNYCFEISKIR